MQWALCNEHYATSAHLVIATAYLDWEYLARTARLGKVSVSCGVTFGGCICESGECISKTSFALWECGGMWLGGCRHQWTHSTCTICILISTVYNGCLKHKFTLIVAEVTLHAHKYIYNPHGTSIFIAVVRWYLIKKTICEAWQIFTVIKKQCILNTYILKKQFMKLQEALN